MTKIDFRAVPKVDILTGGFPCQDISHAGKGVGITGSRSSLWKYYLEAIRVLRPRFALIENVSALVGRGLNVVLANLAEIGYDAEWYNISASSVGAFHQRERIFIIAYSNSYGESNVSINDGERQRIVDEVSNSPSIRLPNEEDEQVLEGEGGSQLQSGKSRSDDEISNPCGIGCNNWSNNREERQIQDVEERSVEKDKSEGDGWEHRSGEVCENVSNSQQRNVQESELRNHQIKKESGETSNGFSDASSDGCGWWATEPGLGRVANGISNRVDRIKCIGNAVVPQLAEVFAKAIKEYEMTSKEANTKVGEVNEVGGSS